MKGSTAKDVMNAEVLSVAPELTVHELAGFLVEHQISGAPVVDHRGHLVGLVSLTDIADSDALRDETVPETGGRGGRRARRGDDLAGLRVQTADLLVKDIMTPTVYSVEPDTPVPEMARTMVAGRIHRLVVTEGTRVVGIVTSLDLLRLLVAEDAPPATSPRRPPRNRVKGAALGVLLALVVTGCRRVESEPVSAAAAPSAAPASSAPDTSLPPGHPPLDSMGAMPKGHPAVGAPVAAGEAIRGTVTLAPALRDKAPQGGALFLIARAADKQIVAVRKEDAVTFPFRFELSGQDAMTQGSGWSGALEITARLSRSGDAAPATGDIEGRATGVAVGARDVKIELDQVR
ncbi:MAG TPA: CBS domain-containing protein [Vicinamibacteria bacterium]|nr:CBS domain-containing protein [Vicinamibacteria bacterium]